MAIEPVKKTTVIVHRSLQDEVVNELQKLGTVHVDPVEDNDYITAKQLAPEETHALREYVFRISEVDFLLGFLKENRREKAGFFKTMIKDKYPMTIDEFMRAEEHLDIKNLYADCSGLERRLIVIRDKKARLEQEKEALGNWTELGMPLSEVRGGDSFGVMAARVAISEMSAFDDELNAEVPETALEKVSRRGAWTYCLIMLLQETEEKVTVVLSRHGAEQVALPETTEEPLARIQQIEGELAALEPEREEVLGLVEEKQTAVPALNVVREFYESQRQKIDTMTSFGVTESTVAIEGWVTERGLPRTVERLNQVSDELALELADPGEDDDPPVSLINHKWIRPFEMLVKMFGPPNRLEYDPTWLFAISFMVFFGFCIGDVGYGIVLVVAFLLMRKYLPFGRKVKDLLTALTYGSAMAIVFGVLTASWFGIETKELPQAMRSMAVLDPLKSSQSTLIVMGVCIAMGLVHMLSGVGVELRDNWRAGNKVDALIDQGLVFLLFVGGGIAGVLVAIKVLPMPVAMGVAGAAILGMLVLLGRGAASVPGKIITGVYETYGTVVGFVSDAISYIRLFALGLATFIIGFVINTMAGLVQGIGPVIGILLMILILVVGHTFNVLINLLGAFVHPLRLEFVEFFGKFYDDGGRDFKPLGIDSKIVMIDEKEGA